MKPAIVLDVSACIPWCCDDERNDSSEKLLDWAIRGTKLHVPARWFWEILNVVSVVSRRGRITSDRAKEFLLQLREFDFKVEPPPTVNDLPRMYALANEHALTAYDAAYLDLALRLAVPLATLDRDLGSAEREHIEIVT